MKKSKIILLSIIVLIFIINTVLVCLNLTDGIDTFIHNLVLPLSSESADKLMKFFTFLGSTLFIISVAAIFLIICIIRKKWYVGVCSSVMIALSTLLNNVIKWCINRPRPVYMTVIENTTSYPSGHSMASMLLYGFFIYLIMKSNFKKTDKIIFSIILAVIILSVGFSRIYLGAHFITDVIGAYSASLILITIFDLINDKKNLLRK